MKICFLEVQPFPYNIGGGTTHLIDLSKYFIKKGHDVSVITSKPGDNQKPLEVYKGFKVYNVGIPHKIFRKSGFFETAYKIFYRFLWEISWVFAARKKLKEINPDICNPQSLITTALPCVLAGCPYIAVLHGIHLKGFRKLWGERKSRIALVLSKIYEAMENFNGKRANAIVCDGQEQFDYYKKFGKNKCSRITLGIDPENISKVNLKKKKNYLFMSRLTEQKGVSYLINALEILDKKGVKIEIDIAGDGEPNYVNPLKERASKFKNVKANFLGFVIGRKKFDLYAKSKVFISSSIFEPFGLVLVEAMASGCAIIASDTEGGKLLIKDKFGKVVKFINETAGNKAKNLAKIIEESLKWDIKKMGKFALEESKKHSYDRVADDYIALFKEHIRQ
jgi:glycosyltransferase involved in cell wall biosynthesis